MATFGVCIPIILLLTLTVTGLKESFPRGLGVEIPRELLFQFRRPVQVAPINSFLKDFLHSPILKPLPREAFRSRFFGRSEKFTNNCNRFSIITEDTGLKPILDKVFEGVYGRIRVLAILRPPRKIFLNNSRNPCLAKICSAGISKNWHI